jgi:hypothetical protein
VTNRPKNIGTAAETAVVRAARRLGFPHAERVVLHGSTDMGDVRLTPGLTAGVIVEVKGGHAAEVASDMQVLVWLAETETERVNANADVALLVTKRKGHGPARANTWWAHLTIQAVAALTTGHLAWSHDLNDLPVRMRLDTALVLLRAAGYGQSLDDLDGLFGEEHAA